MSNAMTNFFRPGFGFMFDDNGFDRLFRNIFPAIGQRNADNEPSQPVYYTNKDGTELYVELPGCKKENISVEADADTGVIVRATREVAGKKDSFRISFKPDRGGFDLDEMKPTYVDGLLTIPVKEKKQETTRKIAIE